MGRYGGYQSVNHAVVWWTTESECRNLGQFNHWLSKIRGHESLKRKAGGQDQARTALDHTEQLPSGHTSAPCATATQVSSLELQNGVGGASLREQAVFDGVVWARESFQKI